METYEILRDLAIIIIAAEVFGLLARAIKAPQVVGQIIAGLLIGPCVLGLINPNSEAGSFIKQMAEIGVVMIMFSAGLETNLKDLMRTGVKAFLIACCGVFIPLICGYFLSSFWNGFGEFGSTLFIQNLFIGVILTATSVSITVQALREMGRLKGMVGTTILSAAIIDDVIGIIVLTFVISMKDPSTSNPGKVVLSTVLFFVLAIVVGILLFQLFKFLDKHYEHHRRIPIFSLCICFAFAYIAEKFFGIADITGAYVAGIIFCNLRDAEYIERRTDITSYMIFGPIFFAGIGLKTSFDDFTLSILWFSLAFVAVGLVAKIVGCGLMAKLCRFNNKDSLKIGVGMMTRGEVALIVSQKGLDAGILDVKYFTAVILLIIISSISTPIILKLLYRGEPVDEEPAVEAK
jgi:Kef-type K+ transport system membrane component KefB